MEVVLGFLGVPGNGVGELLAPFAVEFGDLVGGFCRLWREVLGVFSDLEELDIVLDSFYGAVGKLMDAG